MKLNKTLRLKTINFMMGLLKKDINEVDNIIRIELQSDVYNQILSELRAGKVIRILIDHELMNIVKFHQQIYHNGTTNNYVAEFFVIRGVENTQPVPHKSSNNTVVRQVLTSELFETQYNSTELDKVLYNELESLNQFVQDISGSGFINNMLTSNVQINQNEYQGNLLVVDFDVLEEYANTGYNPGSINTSVNSVLFYPRTNPSENDKLSLNSLVLYKDTNNIVHYYYITNIIKDSNNKIVCQLQEIPSNSGVLQNISFVYSKYHKSLFMTKDGTPTRLQFVKDIIDGINRNTQQNLSRTQDTYYTTNQELYNVINSNGQNTAPGKYFGFFNNIDRLLTVTYYPNSTLSYSTNTLNPYPNKIVSDSRVLFDLTRNNLYIHNKDIIVDQANNVSFYGNISFKTGLTIDGKSDNLFRVSYSTNNKTYINFDNNPNDGEQDLTISTVNNFDIQTRYFRISDRNTTPNQIVSIDTNTQTDRKLSISNLNSLSMNSNNISIMSPTKTQLTVGDKLTFEALKSTNNLVDVNVDYINTLTFKNVYTISIRNDVTTESINVSLSNQLNKTITLSNLNNFSVLTSVNNVTVNPYNNIQLTAPNISINNVNTFNLSQKINTSERTVLTIKNTGIDLNVSVILTNVNVLDTDTSLVNINTKSVTIKDGTNEYIKLQTGTTNTLTINNLSNTSIISNIFSLKTGTVLSPTEKISVNTDTILLNNSTLLINGSTLQFNTQSVLTIKNGTTGNNVIGIKVNGTDNYLETTTKNVRIYTTNNTKINLNVSGIEKEILSIVNNNNTSEFNVTANKIYLEGSINTSVNTNKFTISTNTTEYLNITNTGTAQTLTISNLSTIDVNTQLSQTYKINNNERLKIDDSSITTNVTNLSIKYNTTTFVDINTNTNSINTTVKNIYTKVSDVYKLGVIYDGINTTNVVSATNSASSVLLTLNANNITTVSNTTNINFHNIFNIGLPTKTYLILKNDDTLSVNNLSTTTFDTSTSHLFKINGGNRLLINTTNVDITVSNLKQSVTDFNVGSGTTYLNLNTTNNLVNVTTKDFNVTTSNITSNVDNSFIQNVKNQFTVSVSVNNGISQTIKNVLSISNSSNTSKVLLTVDNIDTDVTSSLIVRKGSYNYVIVDTPNNTLTTQANNVYVNSNTFYVTTYINNGIQQITTTVVNITNTNNKQSLYITTNNFNVISDNLNTTISNVITKVSNTWTLMKNTTEYINVNLLTDTTTSLTVNNFNTISLTSNNHSIKTGSVERVKVDNTNVTINTNTLSIINNGNTFVTTNITLDKGTYTFDRLSNFIVKKVGTTNNELFKLSETILSVSNLTTVDINVPDIKLSGTNTNINSTNLYVTSDINFKSGKVMINNDTLKASGLINIDTDVSNYYFKVGGTNRITLNGTDLTVSSLNNVTFTTTNFTTNVTTFIIKKDSLEYIKVTNSNTTQSTATLTIGNVNNILVNQVTNTELRINDITKLSLTASNLDITQSNVIQKTNNFSVQTTGGSNIFTVDTTGNNISVNTSTVNINTNTLTFRTYVNTGTSTVQSNVLTIQNVNNTTQVAINVSNTNGFIVNGNTVFNTSSLLVKNSTTEYVNLIATGTTTRFIVNNFNTTEFNTSTSHTFKVNGNNRLELDITNVNVYTSATLRLDTPTMLITSGGNTFVNTTVSTNTVSIKINKLNTLTINKDTTSNNTLVLLNSSKLQINNLTNVSISTSSDINITTQNVNTEFNGSYIVRSTTTPSVEFVNINTTSNNITLKGNTISIQKTDGTQTVNINTQNTGTTNPTTPTVTVNGTIKTNVINLNDKVYIQFNPTTNELEFVFV